MQKNCLTPLFIYNRMKPYERAESDDSDTEIPDVDVDKLSPVEIGPDEHKLQYTYCLWYHKGLAYKIKSPSVISTIFFCSIAQCDRMYFYLRCFLIITGL